MVGGVPQPDSAGLPLPRAREAGRFPDHSGTAVPHVEGAGGEGGGVWGLLSSRGEQKLGTWI